MTDNFHISSENLVARLLEPFRRSLHEAVGLMDREIDEDRIMEGEEYINDALNHRQEALTQTAGSCAPPVPGNGLSPERLELLSHNEKCISKELMTAESQNLQSNANEAFRRQNGQKETPLSVPSSPPERKGSPPSDNPSESKPSPGLKNFRPLKKGGGKTEILQSAGDDSRLNCQNSPSLVPQKDGSQWLPYRVPVLPPLSGLSENVSGQGAPLSKINNIEKTNSNFQQGRRRDIPAVTDRIETQIEFKEGALNNNKINSRPENRKQPNRPVGVPLKPVPVLKKENANNINGITQPLLPPGADHRASQVSTGNTANNLLTPSTRPARSTPEIRQQSEGIAKGIEPVLEKAYDLTQQFFPAVPESDFSEDSTTGGRVNNTFNVNVSMSSDSGLTMSQQDDLEGALVHILRLAARRQGLEV
ncbi:MAG: hypothetical protein OEV42_04625 [Deltaproteobacteria bacterium]|nr:hypothetical protein [Deltaproteobacteria bacterium]